MTDPASADRPTPDVDVVVVGAGMAGLYLAYRLSLAGYRFRIFEAADGVGGTWYWNRYPGARVDVPSIDYMYSFDPDWQRDWQWSEKYATQPELLRYLNHVADKHDLRRHITFSTRVQQARWADDASLWHVSTDRGDEVTSRFLVMATGCLSMPKQAEVDGLERFTGEVYFTSRWPHDPVDFRGKRVAVIGTGSSGVQTIPVIAREAQELVVFQRTPCFSIPARNGPLPPDKAARLMNEPEYRAAAKNSPGGIPMERSITPTFTVSETERQQRYEDVWQGGMLFDVLNVFADVMSNPAANHKLAEFFRNKIRTIVDDPQTAADLCPTDYPIATKRPCLDTDYYATYNLPHVRLVNVHKHPIRQITETGIDTAGESFTFDVIVFATGFDAVTGALTAVDIRGRNDLALKDKWADGPKTYLGLTTNGFPNLFLITGPGSPSVLSNMIVSIEQHSDWVLDCLDQLNAGGFDVIEPTELAEAGWTQHVNDCAEITLYPQANSWYMGANVPGKPRVFLAYCAGLDFYRASCDEVAARDYLGFTRSGPGGSRCNDGVVRRLQPDVEMMLDATAELGLPPIESMSAADARTFYLQMSTARPPGPDVGEIIDGVFSGATGDLAYRLYRPTTAGPHPIVVYFHGGGYVLGDAISDDPLCRDLCVRSDTVVVSADYRHAPEHRFPTAIDDAMAAVRWFADNAEVLGGRPNQLAVCGWSAGGGIAAVVCQLVRDLGGPAIAGQVLLTPMMAGATTRASITENGDGYGLTTPLLRWFCDHYIDPADRNDPRFAPLHAPDLSGLPPAIVVTAEFDPLRDDGEAYAAALAAAGVPTEHVRARGHTHQSVAMVDAVISGAPVRARMADSLRRLFVATRAPEPAS
ncbi:putative flavin-containing monooxygenase [Ilumatobacter coccineus YM16-304] [Mycobacterium shimoidei]|uniref:Putative flavin-containing monooxygenase [Ilumatobacter coccineus YM16-304] n=1 Tax=Mycobacterium shimoidei TaxID=29313 RepID=A0A375YVQ2_MYCSH|nr:alpha/beta hydrolase fold domain-containing protein [Mycobacterium shimoidei]SRX92790.1 putative flavin-containing monooxygenase [Ilumatobacter coccineus YM16-304] [Mycobacterium shimoidei]